MNTQLNKIPFVKTGLLGSALLLSSVFSTAQAGNYPYASIPLFNANGVQPNVALIIDNSSSMLATDTGGSGSVSNTCTTGTTTAPLTRLKAAENAACQVIIDNASSMRIGLWDFTTSSPGGAVQINDFGAKTATQMEASINGLVGNSYGTPLSDAVHATLTSYFGSSSPIQYRCQKNFVVLFTDGSADAGVDDESSSITLPSLSNTTQQYSTWSGATTVKTGGTLTSPASWDGMTNLNITWLYPPSTNYTYYTWMDDLAQMGYDVDIKDGTSAKPTTAFCGNPTGVTLSAGKDCAGKNWNGSDDTTTNAALYKQQNVITYTIGFGDESNNEVMRDTPLVNQVAISPSQVNLSADTITVTGHGLSTGAFVHYYQTLSSVVYKGPGSSSAESITVSSTTPASYTAPDTGTSLTYSNGGGTTQQYNLAGTGTYTCGSVGGLTSGSTYYVSTTNLATNTFELASTKGGAAINLSYGTAGVLLSFSRPAVAANSKTTANLNTSGTSPINTTGTITLTAHGFSTGDYVTYTCSSTGTKCPTGITSGNSYYILAAATNTFQLSSTLNGSAIALTRPTATTATATFVRAAITADSPPGVIATATPATVPINPTTEVVTVSAHGFSAYDAVTYTCANQTYPTTTPTNLPSPVYSVYVDSTHFKLASSLANALAGTTLDLSNTGNANQTFSQTNKVTIGGLFPYATDAPAQTATGVAPTYSSSSPSNAEGKYYVEVIDANTIKLHQCGVTEVLTSHPLYCALQVATAVDLTSTGYGTLSTGPGLFYAAVDAATLSADLQAAFLSIRGQTLSQASLTVNSSYYSSGSAYAYLTSFNTLDWSGDIKAYAISSTDGTISTTPSWTASQVMPGSASRNLITDTTYNTAGAGAINLPTLSYTGLAAGEQTGVGLGAPFSPSPPKVLQWMTGVDTTGLAGARTRSNGVIGDILNGSPVYVGPPSGSYNTTLPTGATDQSTYAAFKTAQASRTPMLYVGANDGMLHGFNTSTGVEIFGFIPQGVYTDSNDSTATYKLYDVTQSGYGYVSTKPHHYFVDGPPYEGDAYFSGAWHSVVVGGLGKGGQSIYALDVTNPTSFTKSNVLWEVNDTTNIGYTFGQPTIARVCTAGTASPYVCTAYEWVAIFANGYNATGNLGYLYVVDIGTGALVKKIPTGAAGGLSTATVYTATSGASQGNATAAYAGDMLGNVWRFDLSKPGSSNWTASLLFSAKAGANAQPITTPPVVVDATAVPYSQSQGLIVVIGTGTYFQTSDASYTAGTTTPAYDSLYSIWDKDGTQVASANLRQQTITTTTCAGSSFANCRVLSGNTVDYMTDPGSRGWYINLYADGSSSENGERIAYKPLQIGYILVFSTIVPQNTDPCTGGGTSWFYAVNAKTGGVASALVDASGNPYAFSGIESTVGVLSQGTFVANGPGSTNGIVDWLGSLGTATGQGIHGDCSAVGACITPSTFTGGAGRMTWRQLQ